MFLVVPKAGFAEDDWAMVHVGFMANHRGNRGFFLQGRVDFEFHEGDVLNQTLLEQVGDPQGPFPPVDLLFIDTLHTFGQLTAELEAFARNTNRYIILHDMESFGNQDEFIHDTVTSISYQRKEKRLAEQEQLLVGGFKMLQTCSNGFYFVNPGNGMVGICRNGSPNRPFISIFFRVGGSITRLHLQMLMQKHAVSSVKDLDRHLREEAKQKAAEDLAHQSGLQNALRFWLHGPAGDEWETGSWFHADFCQFFIPQGRSSPLKVNDRHKRGRLVGKLSTHMI